MNPYSPDAVAERARLHADRLAQRDRLKSDGTASAEELARAELDVVGGLARMEAMGDPIPGLAQRKDPITSSAALALTPSPAPVFQPATGTPLQSEPEPDPVEALAARILAA